MNQRLEDLVEEIMQEHLERMDLCQVVPLERRGSRRRRRPKTAIISQAAKEATQAREWSEEETGS